MSFEASCHCQKVKVVIDAPLPTEAMECNCSICRRRGSLLQFFPAKLATISASEHDSATYTFNKHKIRYRFCKTCGLIPFAEAEQKGQPMVAVNVRCVMEVDLKKLKINFYDGASV